MRFFCFNSLPYFVFVSYVISQNIKNTEITVGPELIKKLSEY